MVMVTVMRARAGVRGVEPARVARALLAAVAEGRVAEVLAMVDPRVVWVPVTRPARSVYHGHAGTAQMVADLRAVHGRYRVQVEGSAAGAGGQGGEGGVTLRVRVVRQTGGGDVLGPPVLAGFTFRGGLVTRVESEFADR
jgi:hypothetical protein